MNRAVIKKIKKILVAFLILNAPQLSVFSINIEDFGSHVFTSSPRNWEPKRKPIDLVFFATIGKDIFSEKDGKSEGVCFKASFDAVLGQKDKYFAIINGQKFEAKTTIGFNGGSVRIESIKDTGVFLKTLSKDKGFFVTFDFLDKRVTIQPERSPGVFFVPTNSMIYVCNKNEL